MTKGGQRRTQEVRHTIYYPDPQEKEEAIPLPRMIIETWSMSTFDFQRCTMRYGGFTMPFITTRELCH